MRPSTRLDSLPCILLAAGRGERMRPLTDVLPKPLLTVQGKSLLAWHLEALAQAGISNIVINHAWLGQMIEENLGNGSQFGLNITYSPEASALETAGGICKALPLLKPSDYFLVVNGDVFAPNFPFKQLFGKASELREIHPTALAHLFMVPNPVQHPEGDFYLQGTRLSSEPVSGAEKLTFSGIGLYHPDLFQNLEIGQSAKLAPILKEAMAQNRVSAEKYLGAWHDVGTPQRLQELNAVNE